MRGGWVAGLVAVVATMLAGCDVPKARFALSNTMMARMERETQDMDYDRHVQTITDALTALFGTPDDPFFPHGEQFGLDEVLDDDHLDMAAGSVSTDAAGEKLGLYREHCMHCHGVTGNGLGPTAPFLNPYPRDFRAGIFKFKSTPFGVRPTHEDLRRVITGGLEGTAMPSFKLLPEKQIEALVTYVKYLSIRGEVERELIMRAVDVDPEDAEAQIDLAPESIQEIVTFVAQRWSTAEESLVPPPPRPDFEPDFDLAASIARGRDIYYGPVANCVQCHGNAQLGDGQQSDFDSWSKDFYDWTKPTDPEEMARLVAQYEQLTGLTVRNIIPRNFRSGVFRGGRRPIDIYWRIVNGIEGSPMPAAAGLQPEQIWDLVNFVRHVQFDSLSRPAYVTPEWLQRERM